MPLARPPVRRGARPLVVAVVTVLALAALAACGDESPPPDTAAPELGSCHRLTPADVSRPADDSAAVACSTPHTAETFAIGQLPHQFEDASYDDRALGGWAYGTCSQAFQAFLGADDSLVMRTVVSWAWFRPSRAAWDAGARWYRCDVVGGGEQSRQYVDLPTTAKGLLLGRPQDRWLVCADGPTVAGSVKVPCSQPHTWRAVTTIELGEAGDPYPGDRVVEVRTRDFCSKSVGAWLGYPVDYDFGFTWFHRAEWEAGNRRSVCWAKIDR